jgi:hypothetical protein
MCPQIKALHPLPLRCGALVLGFSALSYKDAVGLYLGHTVDRFEFASRRLGHASR